MPTNSIKGCERILFYCYNPSIFCMILTQPRTTFKQADFFTKWLSYGPLIAKKSPKLNSMGRGPKIDHAHFRMTRTGEF